MRSQENEYKDFICKVFDKIIIPTTKSKCILSTTDDDTKFSFDMKYQNQTNISVRLRTHQYIHYDDVTIRYRSNGGGETEYDKIKKGYGHIYFYGWLNNKNNHIERFIIYDINKIRHVNFNKGPYFNYSDNTQLVSYTIKTLKEYNSFICEYEKINNIWIEII